MPLPSLRNVDVTSVAHEGQPYVCLRDLDGFVEDQLMLTPQAFFIAAHLDGVNGIGEIQTAFQNQFGLRVEVQQIHELVEYLDTSGFLATERYEAIRDQVLREFHESRVRSPYLAGKSYPQEPAELASYLNELFLRPGAPGELPGSTPGPGPALRGLIAPHIDLERGGHCYAHAYLRLFRQGRPHTAFIFGVAHAGGAGPFILTRKDFETPLGVLRVDQEAVSRLEAAADWDPYEDEILHRSEHSIEFQVVMLTHLFGPDLRIVPVLCADFRDATAPNAGPSPSVHRFLAVCREIVNARPGATMIAAADLAHVGPCFGDPGSVSKTLIRRVTDEDRRDLAHVQRLDAAGFYRSVTQDGNARRVCGLNCIYAALGSIAAKGNEGVLLHYDYAHDPSGGIVSFASLAIP